MFQQWGFLLAEIWVLLALAALLGLFAGWIIWGHRSDNKHSVTLQAELDGCRAELSICEAREIETQNISPAPVSPPVKIVANPNLGEDYDGDGVSEGANEGIRPEALTAPRGGVADDLKQIKGIGLKMEQLCNSLGFYHFDQISAWTSDEAAWVDANLTGLKGRVTRDEWVMQAKVLASGGTTAFSAKVSKGDVNY